MADTRSPEQPPSQPRADTPLLRKLNERLVTTEALLAEQRDSAKEEEQRRRGRDRSQIARIIVYLFSGSFVLLLIILPLLAVTLDPSEWENIGEKLIMLISSVLLPVVTLVIGYYFGSERSGAQDEGA